MSKITCHDCGYVHDCTDPMYKDHPSFKPTTTNSHGQIDVPMKLTVVPMDGQADGFGAAE